MIKKTLEVRQPIIPALNECPTTNQQVVPTETQQYPLADGHVIWWRCPACHGWHGILSEETNGNHRQLS